jgi:hypothetical protein
MLTTLNGQYSGQIFQLLFANLSTEIRKTIIFADSASLHKKGA